MNCTFCESPVAPGSRYCSQCGTAVMNPAPANAYASAKPDPFGGQGAYYPGPAHSPVGVGVQNTSTMAIISLIAGIAAWVFIPVIGAGVAILTGHTAKREIRDSGGRTDGDIYATIGLWLGYAQAALVAAGILLAIIVIAIAIVANQ